MEHYRSRPLRVFLCHASTDKPMVRRLYNYLVTTGFEPWIDAEKLLPGQAWEQEIEDALAASDAIIICLSRTSISKEGFVQTEIQYALKRALQIPQGRIFLIPARLEECDVPRDLRPYQWVNLFERNGYEKLRISLLKRSEQIKQSALAALTSLQRQDYPDQSSIPGAQRAKLKHLFMAYEHEAGRQTVRDSVARLQERIEGQTLEMGTLHNWNVALTDRLYWLVGVANASQQACTRQIESSLAGEEVPLKYAIAKMFLDLGSLAMDCIDLSMKSQEVPLRYELDDFNRLYDGVWATLKQILEMQSLEDWRQLREVSKHIDQLGRGTDHAAKSLQKFQQDRLVFEEMLVNLTAIDLDTALGHAMSMQGRSRLYLGTAEENPSGWQQILGTNVLPVRELEEIRRTLDAEILPVSHPAVIMKQSGLQATIRKGTELLNRYRQAQESIAKLGTALQEYESSQAAIRELMAAHGKGAEIMNRLHPIILDTSDEIKAHGQQCLDVYYLVLEGVKLGKKIDLAALQEQLASVLQESERLIVQHQECIKNLQTQQFELRKKISFPMTEISSYLDTGRIPDKETAQTLRKILADGNRLTQVDMDQSYSALKTRIYNMKQWLRQSRSYLEYLRTQG